MSLGEMATWMPLPGAIPQFCARYVDESMGFAVGWNNWYSSSITLCAEISAAATVIQYWEGARDINVAPWITIIIVLVSVPEHLRCQHLWGSRVCFCINQNYGNCETFDHVLHCLPGWGTRWRSSWLPLLEGSGPNEGIYWHW